VRRRTHVGLIVLGVLLVVLGAAVTVWRLKTSSSALIAAAQAAFSQNLPGRLAVKSMSLSGASRLTARGVEIFPPGEDVPLLACEEASFDFGRWELLASGRLPRRVVITRPELTLRYNAQGKKWNFDDLVKALSVGGEAPAVTHELLREGLVVRDASVSIQGSRLFRDEVAHRLSGVNLSVVPDDETCESFTVSGDIAEGLLGSTTIAGRLKRSNGGGFSLSLASGTLPVDESLFSNVPLVGNKIWQLFRPHGPVACSMTLSSSGDGAPIDYLARIDLHGVETLTRWLPATLTSVTGALQIADGKVVLDDVSGLLEPEAVGLASGSTLPARVTAAGAYVIKPEGVTLRVSASDVPLCRKLIEAIPSAGERVWEEFMPEGLADLSLRLDGPRDDGKLRFAVTVRPRDATVTTRYFPAPLDRVSGEVEVDGESVTVRDVVGTIRREALGLAADGAPPARLEGSGSFDLKTGDLALAFDVKDIPVCQKSLEAIPGAGGEIWEDLHPEGPIDLSLRISVPGGGGEADYRAEALLKGVRASGSQLPLPLEDLTGRVLVSPEGVRLSDVAGFIHQEGAEAAHVSISGLYDPGGTRTRLTIDVRDVRVDQQLFASIPELGPDLWKELGPEGLADLSIRLDSAPGGDGLRFAATGRLKGATVATPYFPAPIEGVSGDLEIGDELVTVTNARGTIRPEALDLDAAGALPVRVRLGGTFNLRTRELLIDVDAQDLPLCRKTVEAIPQAGSELWDDLLPQGPVDLSLRISVPGDEEGSFTAGARLKGVKLNARQLPLPLENVVGELLISPHVVRFSDVTGVVPQEGGRAAYVGISGVYDMTGARTRVALDVRNLGVNEDLVHAMPGIGNELWDMLRPEGRVDATVLLHSAEGADGLTATGSVRILEGRALPKFFPVPVVEMSGDVQVDGTTVRFAGLSGKLVLDENGVAGVEPLGYVTIDGAMDVAARNGTFQLRVNNLSVCKEVVERVPGIGRELWQAVMPRGMAAVSGQLFYHGNSEPPVSYFLDVQMEDVSGRFSKPPLSLELASGHLIVTPQQIAASSVTGLVATGWFNAAAVVQLLPGHGQTSYSGTFEFRQVDFKRLVEEVTGKEYDVQGRLTGLVELRGGGDGMTGSGSIELTDGRLWDAPFFATVSAVLGISIPKGGGFDQGKVQFKILDDGYEIQSFQITSYDTELTGNGKVGKDGELDLIMVAATRPRPTWIPFLGYAVRVVLAGVEKEIVKFHVTGPIGSPKLEPVAFKPLRKSVGALWDILLWPFGGTSEAEDQGGSKSGGK